MWLEAPSVVATGHDSDRLVLHAAITACHHLLGVAEVVMQYP